MRLTLIRESKFGRFTSWVPLHTWQSLRVLLRKDQKDDEAISGEGENYEIASLPLRYTQGFGSSQ